MKKPIWAGTCAAIFAIASVAMSAQQSNSTPQDRSESSDRKVTVTGCLEAAPQSATPAAPAADAKSDQAGAAKAFVLTNAAPSADAPAAAAASRTFRLVANEAALSPHAGKKVELTGTLQDSASSSRSSSSASAADSSAPQLVVESGKVLAAKCTE
jgi:hypothetical protein